MPSRVPPSTANPSANKGPHYNPFVATAIHIRCERCTSYRVQRRPDPRPHWLVRLLNWTPGLPLPPSDEPRPGTFDCQACGHTSDVRDTQEYAGTRPFTFDRCIRCDELRVELVARDINPTTHPESLERADLHRCAACGCEYQLHTRDDPNTVYL